MNMCERIKVVKIGGNVVDNPEALQAFIFDFSKLEGPKILVHGGGKEATRLSAALGIETTMIDGRRVTDRNTLDVVTMVYAGLINKRIVGMLQATGTDAIGLSGADGNVIKASRPAPSHAPSAYTAWHICSSRCAPPDTPHSTPSIFPTPWHIHCSYPKATFRSYTACCLLLSP